MKFIDEVTIEVASGKGGPGCVSFRREKYVPRGGPDGGDGGRGGNIIFKTSSRLHSLLDLKIKNKYRAEDGQPGRSQNRSGRDGADLVMAVPPGTIIKDLSGHIIRDLGINEEYLFLEGGIGGKGNTFYKSSVNQAPDIAQKGMPGQSAAVHLELKLIADVGIVGYPNAGKSTLISAISAARPKIADYPFTTLTPNLGVVRIDDEANFIVADMPGLIKGAHEGHGLGIQFLRHIERTKFFVHVIDISGASGRDPTQDFKDINTELKLYDKSMSGREDFLPLSTRAQIVALNKADAISPQEAEKLTAKFQKIKSAGKLDIVDVVQISAVTRMNLNRLVNLMGDKVFNEKSEKNKSQAALKKGVSRKSKKD